MCGLMGIVGDRPARNWESILALTASRGPDSSNYYESEEIFLGHNRLAILDLSTQANQPMFSEDKRFSIIYNGEIFNFLDLKAELENQGIQFKTRSDTEVILEGYRVWGKGILNKLDGMFAFAIWDSVGKEVFLARDHIGIKPIYYSENNGTLIFASEIKTILESNLFDKKIREKSIQEYLAYSYIPGPTTAYENILTLNAGEFLIYKLKSDNLHIEKWWNLPTPEQGNYISSREIRDELSKSVAMRTISDVPIGIFLSGGIDSSIIAYEATKVVGDNLSAFTIGWKNNDEYDESLKATKIAKRFKLRHEIFYPEFSEEIIENYIDLIVNRFDQPFGNPTVVLTDFLTKQAYPDIKVILVGDGGDEIFGGYPRHWALNKFSQWENVLKPFSKIISKTLNTIPERPDNNHIIRRMRSFFSQMGQPLPRVFEEWTRMNTTKEMKNFIDTEKTNYISQNFIASIFAQANSSPLGNASYADCLSFLPFNLLDGADRMSMTNSVEIRLPFLSKKILELSMQFQDSFRVKGQIQKTGLKEAYTGILPEGVLQAKKRGFNPPVWNWLQDYPSILETNLNDQSPIFDFISKEYINSIISSFLQRRSDYSFQLWGFLVLNSWLKKHY